MMHNILPILTQTLLFIPLGFAISISFNLLRATDMTLDGSFVLGATVFAKLISCQVALVPSCFLALAAGAAAGLLTAYIQRHDRVDPLFAGILSTFILSSINLCVMGKPNTNLLTYQTLLTPTFDQSDLLTFALIGSYVFLLCVIPFLLLKSNLGLQLRAFGDNPSLLRRHGINIELLRCTGFAMTNLLAAGAGCLTAQAVGYADIGMGMGMTMTGIGAIILGQQIINRFTNRPIHRLGIEWAASFIGVACYFSLLNGLLRLDINPIYLKMMMGFLLIVFLRTANKTLPKRQQP